MNKVAIGAIFVLFTIGGIVFLSLPKNASQNIQPLVSVKNEAGGTLLAGKDSPYYTFTKAAYDKAIKSEKFVFLNFYANWCPICRAEAPELKAGFDSLQTDKIVGFRVNFNDSDTDEDEKALAKQFNVPYQHTKIVIKDGKELARSVDQWDKDRFLKTMNMVITLH